MTRALAEAVRRREPRALARALTVVENDPAGAAALLEALGGARGHAHRVGVTGPPGVGKSTLLGHLVRTWRARGQTVGVLAVDPTSPFSGGALLGDRIRLGALHGDEGVFIRSLASRGHVGGLSAATEDAADVLDAAGMDVVVVETVGVGQAEVDIARAVDTTVLVLAPGSGDEIQAMKAGLLEAADLIVVNQADRRDAERMVRALEAGLALRALPPPPVLTTVATRGEGAEAVVDAVDRRRGADRSEALRARREDRARRRVREAVERALARGFWDRHGGDLDGEVARVVTGETTVAAAAARLVGGDRT